MDIAACVEKILKSAAFTGSATIADEADWASREWKDRRGHKPTWAELVAVNPDVEAAEAASTAANTSRLRAETYRLQIALRQANAEQDTEAVAALQAQLDKLTT